MFVMLSCSFSIAKLALPAGIPYLPPPPFNFTPVLDIFKFQYQGWGHSIDLQEH